MGKKLEWILTGAAGLLLLTPIGCRSVPINLNDLFLSQKPGLSYKKNPYKKRQKLLEEILERHNLPHIEDIIYYDKNFKERYQEAMEEAYGFKPRETGKIWIGVGKRIPAYAAVAIIPKECVGIGKNSVIIVLPRLFKDVKKLEDLVSCIVDHEAKHAKDNARGIKVKGVKADAEKIKEIGSEVYRNILDIFAYSHQLKLINNGRRKVSPEYKETVEESYAYTYTALITHALNGNTFALSAFGQAPYGVFFNLNTNTVRLFKKRGPLAFLHKRQ